MPDKIKTIKARRNAEDDGYEVTFTTTRTMTNRRVLSKDELLIMKAEVETALAEIAKLENP